MTLLLILILTSAVYTVNSGSHNVIVRPTESDRSVCGDHALCDTLTNLLSNNPAVFVDGSDLTLKFLEGNHTVTYFRTQIKIGQKRNVIWHGENSLITCETASNFIFSDTAKLEIRSLTFSNCGNKIHISESEDSLLNNVAAALFLSNVKVFHCREVTVARSKGYGLFLLNHRGNAQIKKCSFLYNNKNCKPDSHYSCVGGNMAVYFLTRRNVLEKTVNISITNCTIKDGSDLSEITSNTCMNQQQVPSSASSFSANGLSVIFAQENYQVRFQVIQTKFSFNNGNGHHPAVLVYDSSEVSNNVKFLRSNFSSESTIMVFSKMGNSNASSEFFTIKKCSFSNGTATPAIHICVQTAKPSNYTKYLKIVSCSFFNYSFWIFSTPSKQPLIKVSYSVTENINTFIEVNSCEFHNNAAPSLSIDVYKNSLSKFYYSNIVTIKNTKFRLISNQQPTVSIKGFQKNAVWKFSKFDSREVGTVNFTSCQFISNDSLYIKPTETNAGTLRAQNTRLVIRKCSFVSSKTTAIYADNSVVIIDGLNKFRLNWGRYGGAFCLNKSIVFLTSEAKMNLFRNTASYGGGIFATPILEPNLDGTETGIYSFCTITISTNAGQTQISFKRNRANYGGSSIFGGNYVNCTYNCTKIGQCKLIPDTYKLDAQEIPQYISIYNNKNITGYLNEISSPVNKICLCENNKPTNTCDKHELIVFQGQQFNFSMIALGELKGSTAATVISRPKSYFLLNIDNRIFFLPAKCKTFKYSVHRPVKLKRKHPYIVLKLTISKDLPEPVRSDNPKLFEIEVHLSPCPLGLRVWEGSSECKCSAFIEKFGMTCDTKRGMVHVKNKQWISFYENKTAVANYPLDYIHAIEKYVNLSEPDKQCSFNRSGILCGACRANFSVVIGSSNCKECSNLYLLLIIPFALAGVALVVLLLKCNLTVSVGHINGIIFYANIVQVNKTLLFPQRGVAYEIFSTFISWLNLDLGIETCFFANMDTYAKVCLQFVFPVYLWIIVGLIILAAHCSSRMGRLIGDNSVPVLATLLLLSYAKLLRTIIAAAAFAYIEFEDGSHITVWQNDGNVKYLHSKHIGLFLIAVLFFLCYILPLILLVLLAPCLQAWSHHRAFRWVNRLKPFLDAYQGPYNDKFRFWTGLLLLIRLVLFVIYASNYTDDISMNFFWTIAVTALLIAVLLGKPVYRHRVANRIELLCFFNIVMLCSVNWLTSKTDYRKWEPIGLVATYISVVVVMLTFLFSILYQRTKHYSCVCTSRDKPLEQGLGTAAKSIEDAPTSSVVELEECNQLKEPLLDSD